MEELFELRAYVEQGRYEDALRIIGELEEMSKDDKINRIDSFCVVLLIHLIKQEAEKRTTRSWELSIKNSVREINKVNKRRKAGGYYLTKDDLHEILENAWTSALDRAAAEAFEGQHDAKWIEQQVDKIKIIQKAMDLISLSA
jgi:hypothetical protein